MTPRGEPGPAGISGSFRLTFPGFALDASFELPARGASVLFGPSGSGKTTLLRCIAGLERRCRGRLSVSGQTWQDDDAGLFLPAHRRALGFVFQEPSLFSHLSVRGNLDYGRRRAAAPDSRLRLERVVELLGISPLLDRMPDGLSGGERQRVAIARALAASPRLLLLDEPLASVDLQRRGEVLPYLERLPQELEIPMVYVSHQPDEVMRLADHLVLLDGGRVSASGGAGELFTRLDLPLAHGDAASAVLEGTVASHDERFHLTTLDHPAGPVTIPREDVRPGARVRLRVLARDVSVALSPHPGSSILNVLPARVDALVEERPGQVLLRLDAAGTILLARVTARSVAQLGIGPGSAVYAQVKGMALLS